MRWSSSGKSPRQAEPGRRQSTRMSLKRASLPPTSTVTSRAGATAPSWDCSTAAMVAPLHAAKSLSA